MTSEQPDGGIYWSTQGGRNEEEEKANNPLVLRAATASGDGGVEDAVALNATMEDLSSDSEGDEDFKKESTGVLLAAGVEQDGPKKSNEAPLTFPQKMVDILANETYAEMISWLPHGTGFIIRDKKRFAQEVLPRYFKKSKFTSFTRKLNRWNFTRVTRGPELGAYYHPLFQRGNTKLAMQMMCVDSTARRQFQPFQEQGSLSSQEQPDQANIQMIQQQLMEQQQKLQEQYQQQFQQQQQQQAFLNFQKQQIDQQFQNQQQQQQQLMQQQQQQQQQQKHLEEQLEQQKEQQAQIEKQYQQQQSDQKQLEQQQVFQQIQQQLFQHMQQQNPGQAMQMQQQQQPFHTMQSFVQTTAASSNSLGINNNEREQERYAAGNQLQNNQNQQPDQIQQLHMLQNQMSAKALDTSKALMDTLNQQQQQYYSMFVAQQQQMAAMTVALGMQLQQQQQQLQNLQSQNQQMQAKQAQESVKSEKDEESSNHGSSIQGSK